MDLEHLPVAVEAPKEFDAVILGRIHEHKGVLDAVPLWREVRARRPEARLLVIGEGPHRAELRRRFEAAGMGEASGAVRFTGGIPDPEKNQLLTRCRVGVSLSREEGWGLSVTEFLAVGLPVVAMDVPVFHDVFPDQLDLLRQGDVSGAAARVVYWLEHADDARVRAQQGRRFIERYDQETVARREFEVLAGAMSSR